ncbi:hypothetical protein ACN9M0_24795 [Streptomyces sp. R-07]|uniref:hypothetical protein n=1 Tax=Streptomyces sp. R-07 TaxID=3404052 RepID=UPI003CF1F45B
MRVQMRVKVSGTRDGVEWPDRGGVVDLPEEEAAQLVHARLAEPAGDERVPVEESATPADDTEKAVVARRRGQARKPGG